MLSQNLLPSSEKRGPRLNNNFIPQRALYVTHATIKNKAIYTYSDLSICHEMSNHNKTTCLFIFSLESFHFSILHLQCFNLTDLKIFVCQFMTNLQIHTIGDRW